MRVLAIACLAHVVIAQLLPAWWVPDVTLVGLVAAVTKSSQRWLTYAVVAGWFMMSWAVRDAVPIAVAYGLAGWATWFLAGRWDLGDARAACGVVALSCAAITAGLLWLEDLWSLVLAGWLVVRVVTTSLIAFVMWERLRAASFRR